MSKSICKILYLRVANVLSLWKILSILRLKITLKPNATTWIALGTQSPKNRQTDRQKKPKSEPDPNYEPRRGSGSHLFVNFNCTYCCFRRLSHFFKECCTSCMCLPLVPSNMTSQFFSRTSSNPQQQFSLDEAPYSCQMTVRTDIKIELTNNWSWELQHPT